MESLLNELVRVHGNLVYSETLMERVCADNAGMIKSLKRQHMKQEDEARAAEEQAREDEEAEAEEAEALLDDDVEQLLAMARQARTKYRGAKGSQVRGVVGSNHTSSGGGSSSSSSSGIKRQARGAKKRAKGKMGSQEAKDGNVFTKNVRMARTGVRVPSAHFPRSFVQAYQAYGARKAVWEAEQERPRKQTGKGFVAALSSFAQESRSIPKLAKVQSLYEQSEEGEDDDAPWQNQSRAYRPPALESCARSLAVLHCQKSLLRVVREELDVERLEAVLEGGQVAAVFAAWYTMNNVLMLELQLGELLEQSKEDAQMAAEQSVYGYRDHLIGLVVRTLAAAKEKDMRKHGRKKHQELMRRAAGKQHMGQQARMAAWLQWWMPLELSAEMVRTLAVPEHTANEVTLHVGRRVSIESRYLRTFAYLHVEHVRRSTLAHFNVQHNLMRAILRQHVLEACATELELLDPQSDAYRDLVKLAHSLLKTDSGRNTSGFVRRRQLDRAFGIGTR